MAPQTVQDQYRQLLGTVSGLLNQESTSVVSDDLAHLDEVLLKLKLWGVDVNEASGTLLDIDQQNPLLAGILRDVFDTLSVAVHDLVYVDILCAFQGNSPNLVQGSQLNLFQTRSHR